MVWQPLGGVTLSYVWQSLGVADIGSDLIRVTQSFADPPTSYALFSWIYANGGRSGFKRIYPSKDAPLLIESPVPLLFRNQGLTVRYASLKIASRTRIYAFDWLITVEAS